MTPMISLLMPTRARPELALRFLTSAFESCCQPDRVEVMMVIDDDDTSYDGFVSPFERTKIFSVPPSTMSGYNRIAADRSSGEILMLVNDDIVVESNEWDNAVRQMHAEFSDRLYLGFPNDGFKGSDLSVFPIISKQTYENFEVLPALYSGAFIDTHLHEIFKNLKSLGYDRIRYLSDVRFTHHHFRVTKEVPDETYVRRDRFGDDRTFLLNVRVRHRVALDMLSCISHGHRKSSAEASHSSSSVFVGILYYLFKSPQKIMYRVHMVAYMLARLAYRALFVRSR